ncbi:copper resistance protein B [Croceicoccus sediminis]|uniref:copper resistance protein B n=1 Tax=Croceicoccus sediminis TaxID=2571150 RepID=UPI001478EF6A|nr:copper resistance protein B [Croceicoccus sediminis]
MAQAISVEVDRFELQAGEGDDPFLFDSTASIGSDSVAAVFKAEGGHEDSRLDVQEVESKAMIAFMPTDGTTLMAGVRHDFRRGSDLTFATLAIEQSLGSLLEGEHYLFLSEDGDVTGAAQVLAGLPVMPSLTLEPRFVVSWSAQEIAEEDTGSGVTDVELSVRLRQAIGPIFNVYVGAMHERLVGNTRDIARANGDRANVTRALVGAGLSF